MDPRYLLAALLGIWDELPFLLGMEAWSDLYRKLEPLVRELREAESEDARDFAGADVVAAFSEFPVARQRLRRAVEYIHTERSGNDLSYTAPSWERLLAGLEAFVHPKIATRYTDILAPRRVQRGKRGTVTITLTVGPEATSRESAALGIRTARSVDISLRALSPGLKIVSAPVRKLWVRPDADSPPISFVFKGNQLGRQTLCLDFFQGGRRAGSVELPVEVIREVPVDEDVHDVAGPAFGDERHVPQPIDLEIVVSVKRRGGVTLLGYTLHSPSRIARLHHKSLEGPELLVSPEEYRAALMAKLENLQKGLDIDGRQLFSSEIEDKLAGIGHDLYHELFTEPMKLEYRRYRTNVRTIQLTTADPWIPWEIIKPYDDTDPDLTLRVDDDFLGCQFQLTRWLSGSRVPSGEVRATQLACIEAGDVPRAKRLPYAEAERKVLSDLAVSHGLRDTSPKTADFEHLNRLLAEGGNQILHFVAHGDFVSMSADESGILLVDDRMFRTSDLHGPLATRLSEDCPLVFLNACRVGQQGWSLAGLGGWANRWIRHCGCGALVAPFWVVSDRLAFEVAKVFYSTLEENGTFGEAAQKARLRARAMRPDSPTWLAYAFYAHPNGRLTFVPIVATEEVRDRPIDND